MSEKYVLCVDDEYIILVSLEIQLKELIGNNFTYILAQSAEEGLEIVNELKEREDNLVAVISDWLMPGMKGDDFLIEINKSYPKALKIMLTGQANDDAIERARKLGGLDAVVAKPWSASELGSIVAHGLRKL